MKKSIFDFSDLSPELKKSLTNKLTDEFNNGKSSRLHRVKLKQRKERKETRKKLIFKLVKNDHKCRQLRMQLARKNTKALSRQEYLINEEKVKQIIYLTFTTT